MYIIINMNRFDGDFQIHTLGQQDGGAVSKAQLEKQFEENRGYHSLGFEKYMEENSSTSPHSPDQIKGIVQSHNKCLSTCITAWAVMNGLTTKSSAATFRDKLHQVIGDDDGARVDGLFNGDRGDSLLTNLNQHIGISLTQTDNIIGFSPRYRSDESYGNGRSHAEFILRGGAMVLQDGNHFLLSYCDSQKQLWLFDPLTGNSKSIGPAELYGHLRPKPTDYGRLGSASILKLPRVRKTPQSKSLQDFFT